MVSVVSGFNVSSVFYMSLFNKIQIIMVAKLTHHGDHIIYVIYINYFYGVTNAPASI
jgi:hypothetical protein